MRFRCDSCNKEWVIPKRIAEHDILQEQGGLPESKLHCPKLAVATLQKAIAKYQERKRKVSQL